jgi:protoporphyrinogen IX oxidase
VSPYYLWIKAFHIVFVVSWFAGVFYLPRLFVNHAMVEDDATKARLALMERKLYRFITPMMLLAVGLGTWLIFAGVYAHDFGAYRWLHVKILLVAVLIGYHFWMGMTVRRFAAGQNTRTHIQYRILNELPVLLLIAVVILVVVKPF